MSETKLPFREVVRVIAHEWRESYKAGGITSDATDLLEEIEAALCDDHEYSAKQPKDSPSLSVDQVADLIEKSPHRGELRIVAEWYEKRLQVCNREIQILSKRLGDALADSSATVPSEDAPQSYTPATEEEVKLALSEYGDHAEFNSDETNMAAALNSVLYRRGSTKQAQGEPCDACGLPVPPLEANGTMMKGLWFGNLHPKCAEFGWTIMRHFEPPKASAE